MPSSAYSTVHRLSSLLSPACRPSPEEVENYARLIVAHEGSPADALAEKRREAELQLWAWRNEHYRRHQGRWRRALASPTALAS
jgi:hypothetical protein